MQVSRVQDSQTYRTRPESGQLVEVILAATSIKDQQWRVATTTLPSGGRIERKGEKRGARYRSKNGSC